MTHSPLSPATGISAIEIAGKLGLPTPTDEQVAVIEAPLEPALVVAGAGSGKTETMANRIVWLLANGHVRVPEILGLTFTRKAAGELAQRVRERIAQLQAMQQGQASAPDIDVLEAPTISTYNAFASGLFREYARLIGREPDATVITEASAWRLARDVVVSSADERLVGLEKRLDDITSAVVALAHSLSDNDALDKTDEVRRFAEQFRPLADLPIDDGTSRKKTPDANLMKAVADVDGLGLLVTLAEEFADAKRRRGFIEYSDQVALALDICRRVPRAAADYRERFKVVILDEYQDTSVVQTDLLSTLFAEHPVMAVGDPNQSIYGWRGASASNLARFSRDFSPRADAGGYSLSTSWRNSARILDAANRLVAPLPVLESVPVRKLSPSPFAGDGLVTVQFDETIADEAESVSLWLKRELARPTPKGQQRSAALLCRSLKKVSVFTDALDRHDVPYHVLGLAGLLDQPVIVDLVCALRVMNDPSAGSELIRLLSGARWRIGARDISALSGLARWIANRDIHQKPIPDQTRERMYASAASDDGKSLVDALDFLVSAPDDHSALSEFSDEGLRRMRIAGRSFISLRRRAGLDLQDLVNLVVQELLLDIEVAANEHNSLGAPSLEAFSEQIASYLSVDERGTLSPFLSWLEEAEKRENLSPRSEDAEPGTVQILTIHGAKGLEWDSVAVPRVVCDELPSKLRSRRGWTAFGELPFEFRGDRHELPVLAWRGVTHQQEFAAAYAEFGAGLEQRDAEEQRRLAYVAITRARDALLVTGSFWAMQKEARGPSEFLREIVHAVPASSPGLPDAPDADENPIADIAETVVWPLADPLGSRAEHVHAAASQVRDADAEATTRWSRDIDLLLAERARRMSPQEFVDLPYRVPASRFKDFVTNPGALATLLRRPVPEKPYRQTRLGTLFHSWVENRSGIGGGQESLDSAFDERDLEASDNGTILPVEQAESDALERLQEIFERSEWADLKPVDVEQEINFVLAGQVVICKLDAVYVRDGRYQIVDWKTGKAPKTSAEVEDRQLQLALYRAAYAQWKGIDPNDIDAVLYYVSDDLVLRPDHLYSEEELRSRWESSVLSS